MSTLSTRLKQLLMERGLSQKDLVDAACVKPSSVSDWLSGESKTIKAEPALRIARAFHVSPWWLVLAEGPMELSRDNPPPVPPSREAVGLSSATELVDLLADALQAVPAGSRREAVDLSARLAMSPDSRMAREEFASLLGTIEPAPSWRSIADVVVRTAERLGRRIPADEFLATVDTNFRNALRTRRTQTDQSERTSA